MNRLFPLQQAGSLRNLLRLFLYCVGLATALGAHADTLTYKDLCHRLTDLDRLAVLPPVGEKEAEATSYDRASQYDAANDRYLAWDANGDGGGKISEDDTSVTMAEITGPGCINRIWSAAPAQGHVRIYLDGSSTPAVDLPFVDYFTGNAAPFNRPNICYHTGVAKAGQEAGGWNNFTPISFQKSCRVVADKNWGSFYHFNYVQFASGTVVPTFSMNLSKDDAAALDKANAILGRCGENPSGSRSGETTEQNALILKPGEPVILADLTGPQAITALKVKLTLPNDAEEQRRFLREIALQIAWDDEAQPAVWSPIGDFFGFVGGGTPFKTLPVGYTQDGWFYSYWYMPFARKARVELVNEGAEPVTLETKVSHAPFTHHTGELARFHAKWHRDAFLPSRADRMPDWTLLTTQGRGRFVGTHLHVWFPIGGWWGEGDEKFFVDGEKFPSWFGTGSEDYFGYAWGRPEFFERPFHSQPLNEQNQGHIDDNRWHIADSVPFQSSFEGCIEKYQNNSQSRYAAEVYWYLAPGGLDPYSAQPVEERTSYWVNPPHVAATIKGSEMKILGTPTGEIVASQSMYATLPKMWSEDSQFWWKAPSTGDHLDLQFKVATTDTYSVQLRPTLARNYGIVQISLDGRNAGAPIDLYYREVTSGDAVRLDTLKLNAGPHTLGVTVIGKNASSENYFFGFDWFKLEPKKTAIMPGPTGDVP